MKGDMGDPQDLLQENTAKDGQGSGARKGGVVSKKSPTGPTERTPKPEYLISLATYLGVRW